MDVAIIGATVESSRGLDERLEELVFRTAFNALADAGVSRDDLDSVVLGASDEVDGRPISSMLCATPAGALGKDEIKTTDSGLHALALGAMRIESGLFDLSLVISWGKREGSAEEVDLTALDPFLDRPFGLTEPVAAGICASAYLGAHDLPVKTFDEQAAAKRSGPVSADRWVAYPLRQSHFGLAIDGAAAMVLASPALVARRSFPHKPVWLRGTGWAMDSFPLSERKLPHWPCLAQAATLALSQASLAWSDIDNVELSDRNVAYEAMAVESLGLSAPGQGNDRLSAALRPRINQFTTSAFTGLPPVCGGLWRAAEAAVKVRDEPGRRRVLVHDTGAIGAQSHSVVILDSGEDA